MPEQKKQAQILRYSDSELKLLNDTFSERRDLLLLLRKFFLQGELNEIERENVKLFGTINLLPIIRKTYLPEIDLDAPLSQLIDFWLLVDTKGRDLDDLSVELCARQALIDYLGQRFKCLINGEEDGRDIKLKDLIYSPDKKIQKAYADLAARNMIIKNVEDNTIQLWVLAGQKKETQQEIQKRLFRDSSK